MKKVAIIGSVGVPGKYGGFETLAHQLVSNLNHQIDFTVYNSRFSYEKEERLKYWNRARIKYVPLKANGVQSILYDIISMIHALLFVDVLLILGVSGCIFLPILKLLTSKRIIVNIDGLEWRRDKWGKFQKKFLKYSEYMAVKHADEVICDNLVIQQYVEKEYNAKSRLVEYGSDHVFRRAKTASIQRKFPFLQDKYAFKVCRIEPENNIHIVLDAFREVDTMMLVMVGNWENSAYGKSLRQEYSGYPNIILIDPIYNLEILDVFRSNCHIYLHGHSAGGTNPSLVEAMQLGVPIIAFDVNYNRETTLNKALYFKSGEDLSLKISACSDELLQQVAKNMRDIARFKYSWNVISEKYLNAIEGINEQSGKWIQLLTEFEEFTPLKETV